MKVLYVKSWGRAFIEGGLDVSTSLAPLYLRPPLFQFSFSGAQRRRKLETVLKGFYEIKIDEKIDDKNG